MNTLQLGDYFELPITRTPKDIFDQAIGLAAEHGFNVLGDETGGTFEGHGVRGSFHFNVNRDQMLVNILDKPWILPMSVIESKVKELFT
jgi:hypothetical protein